MVSEYRELVEELFVLSLELAKLVPHLELVVLMLPPRLFFISSEVLPAFVESFPLVDDCLQSLVKICDCSLVYVINLLVGL